MHHFSPFLFGFSSVFLGAAEAKRSSSSSSLSNRPPPPDDDDGGAEDCGFFSAFFSLNILSPASEHIKLSLSFNVNSAYNKICFQKLSNDTYIIINALSELKDEN